MREQKEPNKEIDMETEANADVLKEEISNDTPEVPEAVIEEEETLPKSDVEEEESAAVVEEAEENIENNTIDAQIANLKKHDAAILLVKKAKHIVQDAEAQMEACKLLLSDDLKGYEDAKQSLKEGGMDACETLLETLEYKGETGENKVEESIVFEPKEEVSPVSIHDISSGKFTGFLLAFVFGAVTLVSLVFVATKTLGIALDPGKVPTVETCKSILAWFGSLAGKSDPMIGGVMVGIVVFLVIWIVYAIRVSVKAGHNLQFAKDQLEKAEEYAALKGTCKDEMDKVDAHIKDAIETMKTYEIIFNEQKGKLRRIQHLEKEDKESVAYHPKSVKEMEDTYDLIGTIKDFLNTPMSEEGKLSGKSTLFLYRAKNRLEKMIERLY